MTIWFVKGSNVRVKIKKLKENYKYTKTKKEYE